MKSIGAIALFTFAVVTECLGAHSERSRQRSGPIRSVPVAADIKRDTDFDCPEEFGYYPHPNDCTLYYVCVFGGALLESCTGGLMYSHELQTCDWPRNVGCDGTSAAAGEELVRVSERERDPPPPPLPRRNPPPPPPRAQPNPVVTSRGQPKFNREEYEKQQQLYAEVDDLPPVEEIESDRQQRVYRGQPSTIGQVQKDRDGYGSQVVSSRNLNPNVIPASIPQNSGKLGSYSFGTQVEERRTATATQVPQTYSENKNDTITDSYSDRQSDIVTNSLDEKHKFDKPRLRKKRDLNETTNINEGNSTNLYNASDRNDRLFTFVELDSDDHDIDDNDDGVDQEEEISLDDNERGKRQVRYYLQKGYKQPGKTWHDSKPFRFIDLQKFNYNPNSYNTKYEQQPNGFHETTRKPYLNENSLYLSANPFASFQIQQNDNSQSQNNFRPSLPDTFARSPHAPMNIATHIITKSPPISSLINNNENNFNGNPFSALAGGFYNNNPAQHVGNSQQNNNNNQHSYRPQNQQTSQVTNSDSSLLPSTVVTARPVKISSTPQTRDKHGPRPPGISSNLPQKGQNLVHQNKENNHVPLNHRPVNTNDEYDEEDDNEKEDDSSEEDESSEEIKDDFEHDFPDPPYEFSHPRHKYAEIDNPFASPNFDFDAFLAKLRGESTIRVTSPKPVIKNHQHAAFKITKPPIETSSPSNHNSGRSTQSHAGMSTPRPFTIPSGPGEITNLEQNNYDSSSSTENSQKFLKLIQQTFAQQQQQQQQQQQSLNQNIYSRPQQTAGVPIDAVRPRLKPPNFKDDRQLPITYSFERPLTSTPKPNYEKTKGENHQTFSVTQRPYVFVTGTGAPIIFSTPKQQYVVKPEKIISFQPHFFSTGKPYTVSSVKPNNQYAIFRQSTAKPLTTLANEQLSALQNYWKNPSTEFYIQSTPRPKTTANIPKLESLFSKIIKNSTPSTKQQATTTTDTPPKRRPIPKPSPEMNDYYYDEDELYYYEPPVKSKYMPSSEVKPQRPPMAQNYQEYEDDDDSDESPITNNPIRTPFRRPAKYSSLKPESVTKNHNDVSIVTKSPLKESNRYYVNGKIPIFVDYGTPAPNVLMRPEVENYEVIHHPRNRTMFFRKPITEPGPFTLQPPKYLNKTTLRPYTVRHRLAKPTTVKDMTTQSDDSKQTRVRMRHHNIVAQMKLTTPQDSHKQETRFTKTRHDDKTNSLEPTESVKPSSYASPRPKMLYNGSQAYSPDQYDPYYAVYDEDGELYKDTEYVQQYNVASLRPAVQQTYRGTPPPARRPVEAYTPRPSQQDYDDAALIHGQINNQNQYQTPIRHSTRGEGNELGYDSNPSSVKTTLFEATSISTTPSTTSTSTTQRPTIAPFTEAMTPSRYTPRSPTDENPNHVPDSSSESPSDGSALPIPSSPSPMINLSSLAKPFEKTDNSHRLQETLSSTERLTSGRFPYSNNRNIDRPNVNLSSAKGDNHKSVSLTTGFSIRRNPTNSNNPYTLTVLTRPFDHFNKSYLAVRPQNKGRYFNDNNDAREVSVESQEDTFINSQERPIDVSERRKDSSFENDSREDNVPILIGSSKPNTVLKPKINLVPTPSTPGTTKYYLKQVIKRPAPFATNNEQNRDSTENSINTDTLIETALQNARANGYLESQTDNTGSTQAPKWNQYSEEYSEKPTVSPYRTLNNLQNSNNILREAKEYTTSTAATTRHASTIPATDLIRQYVRTEGKTTSKPAYYSYRIVDDETLDQTTKIFSGTVKNVIKAFFDNFSITPKPHPRPEIYSSTTPYVPTTTEAEQKVVNIGFYKKPTKYSNEKPLRNSGHRLQIFTDPGSNKNVSPTNNFTERYTEFPKGFSSTTMTTAPNTEAPLVYVSPGNTHLLARDNPQNFAVPATDSLPSKFSILMSSKPDVSSVLPENAEENSQKFHKLVKDEPPQSNNRNKFAYNGADNEVTKLTNVKSTKQTEFEWNRPNEIATTTSTTKSTTVRTESTTSSTKSISFPTRASRVNPAIKLAATNPGGGRRSYQSSAKCSSDNSLQANPKCNEIKYQRPSSTRGRGSAHYSTLSQSEVPQQQNVNRGTPPTRSRPTLKPSTAVVTNTNPVVDIYANPPRRPAPVYPQPTPDKTAAKCRKDVCLLPDCYCGGKDIPGNLPVEEVPQIVLITFDDAVNDLNKMYYEGLFEQGRINPNGCPISATFYVSHEWTDYSQVQNLYADGHELASHTISHSFGEQFSQKKWNREVGGQREILAAYGGVKLEDVRGMRAPFLSVGGNKMFKMLYDSNFTYDSSLPVYENRPPSWPYTLDYKLFHDCMIPPCPTKSYPGVWEVPMVMWQDLNGGRCSMGDACANPPEAEGVYKMLLKNFDRHYTTNRAPFGLFYHAAWFTQPHHKEGFIMFLDFINQMNDVWIVTNWQALQWVRDPTPISRLNNFQPFQCNYQDRPKKCNNPKVCNLWHKSGVRYMRTCQPCPEVYPWTGKTGIRSSKIDNEIEE